MRLILRLTKKETEEVTHKEKSLKSEKNLERAVEKLTEIGECVKKRTEEKVMRDYDGVSLSTRGHLMEACLAMRRNSSVFAIYDDTVCLIELAPISEDHKNRE